MKRFLKKFLGVAATMAAAYVLVIGILANTADPVLYNGQPVTNVPLNEPPGGLAVLRFREAEDFGPVDVVFMGSSHCYRTFDTAWYADQGLRSFNLGSSAQAPVITYHLAQRYLPKLDPDLVVLEIYSETLRSNGAESLVDQLANRPLTWDLLRMTAATGGVKSWNAFLVQLLDVTGEDVRERVPQYKETNGRYVSGGYVRREPLKGGEQTYVGDPTPLNTKQMEYLDKLIGMIKDQGRQMVLVGQPLPEATLQVITDYHHVQTEVTELAARHGVPFYDFNGLVAADSGVDLNDPALFYDYHHFNRLGADAFNPVFLQLLKRERYVPTAPDLNGPAP